METVYLIIVANVSSMNPSINECLGCRLLIFEVARHHLWPLEAELPRLPRPLLLPSDQVQHLHPGVGEELATAAPGQICVEVSEGDSRGHLSHTIALS